LGDTDAGFLAWLQPRCQPRVAYEDRIK